MHRNSAAPQSADESRWEILTGDVARDRGNVRALLESVEGLYGALPLPEVLRQALDRAIAVTGAERALLLVHDKAHGGLQVRLGRDAAGRDLPADAGYCRTVPNRVWSSGDSHLTVETDEHEDADTSASFADLNLLSVMATPLPVREGSSLGVLYVDSTVHVKEFTEGEFQLFKALGGLVAIAVRDAALRAKEKERERLQHAMEIARQIQQRLLPTQLPATDQLELAAFSRPCDETSGDYFDVITLSSGALALVAGDVSGHGLGPALYMVATRALVHSEFAADRSPEEVLRRLNSFLARDMPDSAFMTMFLGVLSPQRLTLNFASAGHNPTLLVRADGTLQHLERTGPALGILEAPEFTLSDPVALQSGDVLFLHTDGFFEAHATSGEMYGEERLEESLRRHATSAGPAKGVLARVVGDMFRFVEGRPLDDDVTAILARVG